MGNFSIALSGLEADSTALNTIGNNLANLNTTASKEQTTSFEALLYQQIGQSGSGDAIQAGTGTRVSATTTNFSEGTILPDSEANPVDMALAGNGFFIVEQNGVPSLTRAGNFQVANNGDLITQDGQQVLGYQTVDESAKATQNFSVTVNLDSAAPYITTFTSQVEVFDSLGKGYLATVTYRNGAPNAWDVSVTLPAGDETGAPTDNTATLMFDSAGNPLSSTINMTFPGLADGADTLNLTWNLSGITNTPSAFANISSTQDGNAAATGSTYRSLQPIVLSVGFTEGAQATQTISAAVNLNEGGPNGTIFTTPISLFDSLGKSYQATISYEKTNTNTWSYSVTLPPGSATEVPVNNTGTS